MKRLPQRSSFQRPDIKHRVHALPFRDYSHQLAGPASNR